VAAVDRVIAPNTPAGTAAAAAGDDLASMRLLAALSSLWLEQQGSAGRI
jgi:hypothetical protein